MGIVGSREAEAIWIPLGENATEFTEWVWPCKGASGRPSASAAMFHGRHPINLKLFSVHEEMLLPNLLQLRVPAVA